MIKQCTVCKQQINTNTEPYFKIGKDYICDDSVNVECITTYAGWHRKNEDKTQ